MLDCARSLVLRHGWNATAYQVVNPGIAWWFSSEGDAVIGFVRRHGVRVVAGAPVCAGHRLAAVVDAFEAEAADAGERVCYFGAEERLEALLRGRATHSSVLLGAQPVWNPAQWAGIIAGKASLRAQLNRSRNKGVVVTEMSAAEATEHPALQRVLREWLGKRGLPPMHFLVEPETLARLLDRRIFVALRAHAVVAFLVASPAPMRHGWLIEQFVRGDDAPNGTVELLLDAAMRALASGGFHYVTLGLSPLSRRAGVDSSGDPLWLRVLLRWVRAHGSRFYNFDGLDRFKAKFQPEQWEPVYAIANQPKFSRGTLYAIAAAFSDGAPAWTFLRALGRAATTELRWLRDRLVRGVSARTTRTHRYLATAGSDGRSSETNAGATDG
jgi:phosphatidylglycerol lysyltransferase